MSIRRTLLCAGIVALFGLLPGGFRGAAGVWGAEVQRAGMAGQDEPYKPYVQAWEASKQLIDTQGVRALVARLRSEGPEERSQAFSALEAIAGYDFGFKTQGTPEEREKAVARWERYAQDLETAANEWAPILTARPTSSNWEGRTQVASLIGKRAPHPAFLPLLREIVANTEDRYFSNYVRIAALKSISRIRHEGVVEYLIDHLDTDLAIWTWQQLRQLTSPAWAPGDEHKEAVKAFTEVNRRLPGEDWLVLKKRYQEWWAKNKANFSYDRDRVLGGG